MLFQGSIFPNPPKRNRFFLQINLIWKNINISLEIKIAMLKEMICNSLQSKTRLKIYSCQKERSKSDKKTSKKWLVGFLKNCRWSGKGKWNNWMGGRDDIGLGREGGEVKLIHEMFPNVFRFIFLVLWARRGWERSNWFMKCSPISILSPLYLFTRSKKFNQPPLELQNYRSSTSTIPNSCNFCCSSVWKIRMVISRKQKELMKILCWQNKWMYLHISAYTRDL